MTSPWARPVRIAGTTIRAGSTSGETRAPHLQLYRRDGKVTGMTKPIEQGEHQEWDGCLVCAVRAMTQGRPKDWAMTKDLAPGSTVTGVVMRTGSQPTHYNTDPVPFLDLWIGGVDRVRVTGHSQSLREQIVSAEAEVGDTVTATFVEIRHFQSKFDRPGDAPRTMKIFEVSVERGHH